MILTHEAFLGWPNRSVKSQLACKTDSLRNQRFIINNWLGFEMIDFVC